MNSLNHAGPLRRVLIVGDFAAINGGQAKVAIDSARLLADAGLEVIFFAASGPVCAELSHPRIRTVCLGQHTLLENPSRLNAMMTGLWNEAALRALREEMAKLSSADSVIHCHGWAKALSPSVGRAFAQTEVPVLYTMHEYFLACPNGGFFDFQRQEICTRRPLSTACLTTQCDARNPAHKAWRVVRSAVARGPGRLPGGLRHIAYISQTQLGAMRPYLPADARLHSLPNPVAIGGGQVDAAGNDAFVFVGRLAPEKGGLLFARAAQEAGVRAVFVGDGPEAGAIRAANPSAEVVGWVSPDEVQEHLSKARALVFPSLWYECQPLVPIEALVRGVPVICGAWSAASEVVEAGVNGIICRDAKVATFAAALNEISGLGPFDASHLAEDAAPERHLDRLLDIYGQMLGGSVAPAA
ncbi:MAG: glycosyltransferase family 4 protein [Sulfitobacter sp.]|nr:glycosyltransferase family 4 protein [Sulfitobacter sp.]